MVDWERESNGGGKECGGAVVDMSGGVNGSGIVVKNHPIEVEKAAGVENGAFDAVNGLAINAENYPIEIEKGGGGLVNCSTIGVENGAVDAVNALTNDPGNDPIEVEKGGGGLVNCSAIGVENGAVDAVNALTNDPENDLIELEKGAGGLVNGPAIGVENGTVDAVNVLATELKNDPIEVENGADKAANALATEAVETENGLVMDVEKDPTGVENGADKAVKGLATDFEYGAADAVNGLPMDVENDRIKDENGADTPAKDFATEAEIGAADTGNVFKTEVETWAVGDGNSAGSSCQGLRTYKRRRLTKMASLEVKLPEDGSVSVGSVSQLPAKSVKEPIQGIQHICSHEQFNHPRTVLHTAMTSDDCRLNRWTKVVLEQIYQSLCDCANEGGLQGCIQQALLGHPESSCTGAAKASVHSGDGNRKCSLHTEFIANGTHDSCRGNVNILSNGSLSKPSGSKPSGTNADACRRAFLDIALSEKFAELCRLLLENFQGIKVDSFLDSSLINSRMKEEAYESSPALFHSDMQQIWTKLQNVGAEMVALGKSLSDKSRTSYQEQLPMVESDSQAKPEQTEACGVYKSCTCRRCGGMSNGRDCLVCDSCEELYHVSCIEPAVEEIPPKSWYCAKCTANGIESPHGDCVVCEKLNASKNRDNEIEENSNVLSENGVTQVNEEKTYHECNVCRNEVDDGDRFKVCGHPFCIHKYYHVKCLTKKQMNMCGSRWYCPSCLCRACLTDCDDDKIIMCDGCDHAYHIYCMRPPRNSIPRGKWFCRKCNVGIQRIRKAKKAYVNIQSRVKKREGDKEGAFESLVIDRKDSEGLTNNSGGVDMLLTAAKTLKFEEKMAGVKTKS